MKERIKHIFLAALFVASQLFPLSAQVFPDNGYKGGRVTIKGRIANIASLNHPVEYYDQLLSLRFSAPFDNYEGTSIPLRPDSTGRYEISAELVNTTVARLLSQTIVLEPGRTYEVDIDAATGAYTFKGNDTQLNCELGAHPLPSFNWDDELRDGKSDADALLAARAEIARLDSLEATLYAEHPALSPAYRTLRHGMVRAQAADYLVQRRFLSPDVRKDDGTLWGYIRSLLEELPRPYTLWPNTGYILSNYVSGLLDSPHRRGITLSYIRTALDLAEEQYAPRSDMEAHERLQRINELRTQLNDYERILPTASDSALQVHPAMQLVEELFEEAGDPVLANVVRGSAVQERQMDKHLEQIVAMPQLPADLREPAIAAELYGLMQQTHNSLSPAMQALVHRYVNNAYYKQQILGRSTELSHLAAGLAGNTEFGCLKDNAPFEGMTDGAEIWAKIAEPLRGRVIYVDIWGTWCAPCRFDLKHSTAPLHKALADLPVSYVFLCNRSTDEAWRSCIAEYDLLQPHSLHYNLPAEQQAALEKFLQVDGYPTYILFRPDGTRATLPDEKPRPYNPSAVRAAVIEALGK